MIEVKRKISKILVIAMSIMIAMAYMVVPQSAHAQTGLGDSETIVLNDDNTVDLEKSNLPTNYAEIESFKVSDAEYTVEAGTKGEIKKLDSWKSPTQTSGWTNVTDIAKPGGGYFAYYGTVNWGDDNHTSSSDADMKATSLGKLNLRWTGNVKLYNERGEEQEERADLIMTISPKVSLGEMPSGVKKSQKVYISIGRTAGDGDWNYRVENPRTDPTDNKSSIATDIGMSNKVTMKIVKTGTDEPLEGYDQMLFGVKDLDVVDATTSTGKKDTARAKGPFAEAIQLVSGFSGDIYRTEDNIVSIDQLDGNDRVRPDGTGSDSSTMRSGFVVTAETKQFDFIWTGSLPGNSANKDGSKKPGRSMGTRITSLSALLDIEHVKINYIWDDDPEKAPTNPEQELPTGEDEWNAGETYTVSDKYQVGDEVTDNDGKRWEFVKWTNANNDTVAAPGSETVIEENTTFVGEWVAIPRMHKIETTVINGTITEYEENIPAGENRTVTYSPDEGCHLVSVTVDGEAQDITKFPASYDFTNIQADHRVDVVYEKTPALAIEKTPDKEVYNAGDTVNYTVTIKQTVEGAEARNVSVKDTIPAGLTLNKDSITGEGLTVVDAQDQSYELLIPSIKESYSYTYSAVTAEDADAAELTNVVTATAENTTTPVEARATVKSLTPKPTIEKTVSNATPVYGEEITYTIKVKEPQQGVVVRNAVVTDDIPAGVSYVNGSVKTAGDAATASVEGTKLTVKIPELANETTIQFKAKVTAKTGQVKNVAILTGDKIKEQQSETTITVKEPNPTLTKTVSPKRLKVGEYATFTLKVTSDVPLVNGQIVDKSPSNVVIDEDSVECSDDNIECSVEDNVLTAAYERLQGTVTITYEAKVKKAGSYTNVAVLTAENMKDGPLKADATVKATKKSKTAAASKTSKKSNGSGHSPKTGDPMNIWLFVAAMILAIVVGGGAVIFRRRKAAADKE